MCVPERKLSGHKTTDVISADIEVAKSVSVALAVLPFLLPTPQMQLWDSIQISQLKTAELAFRSRKLQGASVDLVFVEAFQLNNFTTWVIFHLHVVVHPPPPQAHSVVSGAPDKPQPKQQSNEEPLQKRRNHVRCLSQRVILCNVTHCRWNCTADKLSSCHPYWRKNRERKKKA